MSPVLGNLVELQFWKNNFRSVNSRTVSDLAFPFLSIYLDASNVAGAGHIAGKDVHAQRMFTEAERQENSSSRELLAIQFVHSSFLPNSRVKRFTDSQGVARMMQAGSMNFNLHKLASEMFAFCFKFGIYLDIEWVPDEYYLSRIVDYDDWELAPGLFQQLDELWEPFTVDCLAIH